MAAPSDFTMDNISGKFSMNKSISDSCDEMWKLQGSSWMARKAAGFAGVTFLFDRHTDSTNVENLDITPIITGGIKAPRDLRVLDFSEKPMENALTGPYFVRTRKVRLSQEKDGEDEFLGKGKCEVQKKERWLEDAVIHARIESTKNGWTLDELWGFLEFNGEKRFARVHNFVGPKKEVVNIRTLYDYVGPL